MKYQFADWKQCYLVCNDVVAVMGSMGTLGER